MKSSLILFVLVCLTLTSAQEVNDGKIAAGLPMKSIPVHVFRRGTPQETQALLNFVPQNELELRFIEANKLDSDACHHVDMAVKLKTDDGKGNLLALNPYAFQDAVKSISCKAIRGGRFSELHLELSPEYTRQARLQWKMDPNTVFGIVIPHDYVDLKKNKACFSDLSAGSQKALKNSPMETVVKLVKQPTFNQGNTVVMTVVRTDIWSQMNRDQGVQVYHKTMDEMIVQLVSKNLLKKKRSIADESGPMWGFQQDMTKASQQVTSQIKQKNVQANMDQSQVKGYAQANLAWTQTCVKNLITGNMDCTKWGINSSKIEGMTQINHQSSISVQNTNSSDPLLTLVDIKVTTPTLTFLPAVTLLGFSVPGVFDLGATADIVGSVAIAILVQATQDLLVNTGTASSCPWVIDWNGSLASAPTIQFGTCTLPAKPTTSVSGNNVVTRRKVRRSISALHGPGGTTAPNDSNFSLVRTNNQNSDVQVLASTSRQTAAVTVGLTVIPGVHLGLSVIGIAAMSAGLTAPLNLNINTKWDTDATADCPANNVGINADGGASLQLATTFFGFSGTIPIVTSPHFVSPTGCIPVV
ncbi:hypothetical protein BGZ83_004037 [Gryganskiella cystojenkinii]|nr:hypothetical protein BGZ83_004037 [Gryganskiella cystojenkinii]